MTDTQSQGLSTTTPSNGVVVPDKPREGVLLEVRTTTPGAARYR